MGFPSRFEVGHSVRRVMSCATQGLQLSLRGIKIKREWPETFPFLGLSVFRFGFPDKTRW